MRKLLFLSLSCLIANLVLAADTATPATLCSMQATPVECSSKLSFALTLDFESVYVDQGIKANGATFQPSLQVNYPLYKGSLYGIAWMNDPLSTKSGAGEDFYQKSDITLGYKLPTNGKYTWDVGAIYHWYPLNSHGSEENRTREFYTGVAYDGLFVNPTVYLFYDIDEQKLSLELSGCHSYDLAKTGLRKTSLDLGALVGYSSSTEVNGEQIGDNAHDGYAYYNLTADLVYHLNENDSAAIGIRYGGNNDHLNTGNPNLDREGIFYWGAKLSLGF